MTAAGSDSATPLWQICGWLAALTYHTALSHPQNPQSGVGLTLATALQTAFQP